MSVSNCHYYISETSKILLTRVDCKNEPTGSSSAVSHFFPGFFYTSIPSVQVPADQKKAKKEESRFGGHFDLGVKHPKGMEENPDKFGGTIADLGAKDAVGVGEGK
jgi:hypothetical protein